MSRAIAPSTLEAFLEQPETKPASEFIHETVIQKPMPQGEHSLLQGELCEAINQVGRSQKIVRAFPELRCTFGGASLVPDIAVFRWSRIPVTDSGRIANRFFVHPDWAIEILSPGQSQTKVLNNLLFCSEQGTELGWLLDPDTESVVIVLPEQRVRILEGDTKLPVLSEIDVTLTAKQIFDWLSL